MAPFYDLVCTRAIARIDPKLAFSIGGEHLPGNIHTLQWQAMAAILDIKYRYLQTLVTETAEQIQQEIDPTLEAFQQQHGDYPALQRVRQVITRQCRRLG